MNIFEFFVNSIRLKKELIPQDTPSDEERKKTTQFTEEPPVGGYGNYALSSMSIESSETTNKENINLYRKMANYPEVDYAVQEIVIEAIISDTKDEIVSIELDKLEISEKIKKSIIVEFEYLLNLMNFNVDGDDLFKNWYIDGRLFVEVVEYKDKPKEGIIGLNFIDPMNIEKVYESRIKTWYWKYTPPNSQFSPFYVPIDLIVFVPSGLVHRSNKAVLSYLHKAIKPVNNLRMIEDAIIIYRIVRAPEKRVFSIDTGNLPKARAEQYVKALMNQFRNRVIYDVTTGSVQNEKGVLAMIEDFWLPKNAEGRGTSVDMLAGGANLGDLDDVYYFLRKVYNALNIPESRIDKEANSQYNIGRAGEITRDEIKFFKSVMKLRRKFSVLFTELLRRQLALKNIMTVDEFDEVRNSIVYEFNNDNHYSELKENEILKGRIESLNEVEALVGKYFTREWIALNILKMTEDDWISRKDEIKKEMEEDKTITPGGSDGETKFGETNALESGAMPALKKATPDEVEGEVVDEDEEAAKKEEEDRKAEVEKKRKKREADRKKKAAEIAAEK